MSTNTDYDHWLRKALTRISDPAGWGFEPVQSEDRAWADLAVRAGILEWMPGEAGVVLGRLAPLATANRSSLDGIELDYSQWLDNVVSFLSTSKGSYSIAGPELEWARQAIADRSLEWDAPDATVKLPRLHRDDSGPYR